MRQFIIITSIFIFSSCCIDDSCTEFITVDYEPGYELVQVIPYRINPKQDASNALINCKLSSDSLELFMWSDTVIMQLENISFMDEYSGSLVVSELDNDTIRLSFDESVKQVIQDYEQMVIQLSVDCIIFD